MPLIKKKMQNTSQEGETICNNIATVCNAKAEKSTAFRPNLQWKVIKTNKQTKKDICKSRYLEY